MSPLTDPPLVRIPLLRFNDLSTGAELDPETGEFRTFERRWLAAPGQGGVEGEWHPPFGAAGWFDTVGFRSALVAFYRAPAGHLELRVAGQRVPLGPDTRSEYEPPDPARLPWRLWGTGRRVLRLFERRRLVFEYRYHGESIWERLASAWDGGAASLIQPAYDLLYEVHRVLTQPGERDRVFGGDTGASGAPAAPSP
jgi:hypothetical protein